MPYYRQVGELPRKRHTRFARPDGGLYAEELMGEEGFSSDSALLYHRDLPTAIVAAEAVDAEPDDLTPNLPLLPRHLRTPDLPVGGDLVTGRQPLLGNGDVVMSFAAATATSGLYRNAIGDEVVYVHSGSGVCETVYGALTVGPGDYVVVPTSTTHRWVVEDGGRLEALVFAAAGHVGAPKRYLSGRGQFLEHSPYCERDLRGPEAPLLVEGGDTEVLVRHRGGATRYTYDHHPFDVVGWDGCLYPYVFSVHDFEPITGRVHQPPPVHQTFSGPSFVICSFVPRLYDYHPQAVPVPYNHANVDSDEVIFYADGDFMSRAGSGIARGSISLHPAGFTHGPQPGSVEAALGKTGTEELAVMLDTFRPLGLAPAARKIEDPAYPWTWSRAGRARRAAAQT